MSPDSNTYGGPSLRGVGAETGEFVEPEFRDVEERSRRQRIWAVFQPLFIFLAAAGVVIAVIQATTGAIFRADLEVGEAIIPEQMPPADHAFTVGIRLRNAGLAPGSALVVAVLSDGREVQGLPREIRPLDTATVSVDVELPPGDHVLSLVAFEPEEETLRRVGVLQGLGIQVGTERLDVRASLVADTVAPGDTIYASVTAENLGDRSVWTVPIAVFLPDAMRPPTEVSFPLDEHLDPGEVASFDLTMAEIDLAPGEYRVWLMLVRPSGERLARPESTLSLVVSEPSGTQS